MSWKAEVIADGSKKWSSNAARFSTKREAEYYAVDLGWRWTAVREWRVVECDDPVSCTWDVVQGLIWERDR